MQIVVIVQSIIALRLKFCLPFSETTLFKDIGTITTGNTGIWKTHKDRMCFFAWRVIQKDVVGV